MASTSVAHYDISVEQGADYSLVVTYLDPDGNPVDLTGYAAKLRVVTDAVSETPLLLFATTSGDAGTTVTLGGAAGTITIEATAAYTAAIDWDTAIYTLLVKSPGGEVTKLLKGAFEVNGGVTW
jgi:hypothetical protein